MKTLQISAAFLCLGMLTHCQTTTSTEQSTSLEDTEAAIENATLRQQLASHKEEWHLNTTDEHKQIVDRHIETLIADSIAHKAIQKGQLAPDFVLTNAEGKNVSLYQYLEKGPVVLIWYRGGWCPYCNLTLHALQEELPNIQAAGGYVLALTPELPDQSLTTAEKHELAFEVLSDVHNLVGHKYGIVYTLTPALAELYHKEYNIYDFSGEEVNELPLAATYIIDQRGVVEYAYLDADYRNRAEPYELTQVLLRLRDHQSLNQD